MCREYGVSMNLYQSRIRHGWTVERALTEPVNHPAEACTGPDGTVYVSVRQMCAAEGILPAAYRYRRDTLGLGTEECVRGRNKITDTDGVSYRTIADFARAHGLRPGTVYRRMERGEEGIHLEQKSIPRIRTAGRLGEKRTMKNGMAAEIIRYGNVTDIDVRFLDGEGAGTVVEHRNYHSFLTGSIRCPKRKISAAERRAQQWTGKTAVMHNGQTAEIICYRKSTDIDIRFHDESGTIVQHRDLGCFRAGSIRNPNFHPDYSWKHKKADAVL
jgi:hypothetical protein